MDYKCKVCKSEGLKLWREYCTFGISLLCAACVCKEQKIDEKSFDGDGLRKTSYGTKTDQANCRVPAVFDKDGSCWGYTSVPLDGYNKWKKLPTYKGL
jgi:hypothetical protein